MESRGWGRRAPQSPSSSSFGAPQGNNEIYTYDVVFLIGEANTNDISKTQFPYISKGNQPTASQSTCPQVRASRAERYWMPRHPRTCRAQFAERSLISKRSLISRTQFGKPTASQHTKNPTNLSIHGIFYAKGGIRTHGRLLAEHTISSRAP